MQNCGSLLYKIQNRFSDRVATKNMKIKDLEKLWDGILSKLKIDCEKKNSSGGTKGLKK